MGAKNIRWLLNPGNATGRNSLPIFQYSDAIRKLIYTTNAIEGFHRQVRKVTKTKGAFTSDMALLKLIYLATLNIQKKWTQPLHNWSITISQLSIKFAERLKLNLQILN